VRHTELESGVLRKDLEHYWANKMARSLDYKFVLPGFRSKFPLPHPCQLSGEVLRLCTETTGRMTSHLSLLVFLLYHPFPWEDLSSHRRKVSVDTCVWQGMADKHQLQDPSWPRVPHLLSYHNCSKTTDPCHKPGWSPLWRRRIGNSRECD
jgi:hypothetical protein